jgi:erythromycin esterase-like protein
MEGGSLMPELMDIGALLGQTLTRVENLDNEEILFTSATGARYRLFHQRDCCEAVTVEDIAGSLDDLAGSPILMAEEATRDDTDTPWGDVGKWTFYRLATVKGYVTIRWYGTSNGYYSISVDFEQLAT